MYLRRALAMVALLGTVACCGEPGVEVPSDLYPIVSPLVGGNTFASAHPYDVDVARDPNEVPASPLADGATVTFTVSEIDSAIAPMHPSADPPVWSGPGDKRMHTMAFSATTDDPSIPPGYWLPRVPGPFLKVVANRTVNVVLTNPGYNMDTHSIDFHAVVGDKGGAAMLMADPGKSASFAIRPTHPGLYVYHCAEAGTPRGIAEHMNGGMYGLVLVLAGDDDGIIDADDPFNRRLAMGASEHYVFEAGGSHIPSFHVIGAIFDETWMEGDTTSTPLYGLQTVMIPSAGTAVVAIDQSNLIVDVHDGDVELANLNILVDHASAYARLGALGFMEVTE